MNRIALMAVAATAYKAATANALERQQAGCTEEEARWQGASFYQAAMGWGFYLATATRPNNVAQYKKRKEKRRRAEKEMGKRKEK